jgi:hypothetical protein
LAPERETGRDTADLISHSGINKIRKLQENEEGFLSQLELKKQAASANLNMISYQTANFGARAKHHEEAENDLN